MGTNQFTILIASPAASVNENDIDNLREGRNFSKSEYSAYEQTVFCVVVDSSTISKVDLYFQTNVERANESKTKIAAYYYFYCT